MSLVVERAKPSDVVEAAPALGRILVACVAEGAGLGFAPPLGRADAEAYWTSIAREVEAGGRVVLLAREGASLVGSAQLDLCSKPNGLHRAEVQKVMVAPHARRGGVGVALLRALEEAARDERRTMLYLDTFAHQHARRLYEKCGWTHAGDLPRFAHDGTGLRATSLYYKLLD